MFIFGFLPLYTDSSAREVAGKDLPGALRIRNPLRSANR